MKALFVGLMLFVALVPIALAESELKISKLKAYVDGDKDSGTLDAKPESEIEIKFDIENIFDKSTDITIEDIEVTAYIEGIDDGEDLDAEDEPDVDDLDAGDDDSLELVFNIPLEVDDDKFELIINVVGDAVNGTERTRLTAEESFTVNIDKEKHDVVIRRAELYNTNIKCGRSTQLDVSLINLGTSDEDDVVLTVNNEDLELTKKDTFNLDNDPFDSDSKYSNSYQINAPKEAETGIYPINVKVSYDNGGKTAEKNVELTVECEEEVVVEEEETTVVVQKPVTTTVPLITGDVVLAEEEEEEGIVASLQSAIGNKGVFALILLIELAVIVIGVVLVVSWVKKK